MKPRVNTERLLYKAHTLDYGDKRVERVDTVEEADLRSSEVRSTGWGRILFLEEGGELHAPALDIDGIHCELVPSSTEGHFHLYIDKPMPWEDYKKLLAVLAEVGIIERSFYDLSVSDRRSFLRIRDKKYDPPSMETY